MHIANWTVAFGLIGSSGQLWREADLLAYTALLLPHYGEAAGALASTLSCFEILGTWPQSDLLGAKSI